MESVSLVSKTRYTTLSLVSVFVAFLGAQAFAQDPAPEAAPPPSAPTAAPAAPERTPPATPETDAADDEVVVRGRRMSEVEFDLHAYVRTFVDQITSLPPGRGYARWHRDVCIGVHNVEQRAGQYIADRISLLAAQVGLEPGEPGCHPDVMVIFTTDGKETAAYMVENLPRFFRPGAGNAGMNLGLEDLAEFAENDRPVRWWHLSMPVDARNGNRAIRLSQDEPRAPPVVNVAGPSRIHSGIRDDMYYVVIVVDATQLRGKTWQQLGDYLAVVSLAQIDSHADLSAFDSILNLFENPLAYSGLTDWDLSYMRALYDFDQEQQPHLQANQLVSRMAKQEAETFGSTDTSEDSDAVERAD
jgi:hypothetical protein